MISISFSVAKEDVLALACHYYAKSAAVRNNRLKTQIAFGLIVAGCGVLALLGTGQLKDVGILELILLLIGAGMAVGFVPSLYRRSVRRSAEKMLEESSYRKAFGNYVLTFSEEGLVSQSPTAEGKYTWQAVNAVALTPEHLLIFLVGPQGFPIRRSQIPDSKIEEVQAFVEAHLPRP